MALDGEEITQITQITKSQNEELFERLSEKLELTVSPIKENLDNHTRNDEKIHLDLYDKLSHISIEQTENKTNMKFIGIAGMAMLGISTSVLASVFKGWL